MVQISSKVGQRGQGLIVMECCGGSESFRCDRKADKSVLDIFHYSTCSQSPVIRMDVWMDGGTEGRRGRGMFVCICMYDMMWDGQY